MPHDHIIAVMRDEGLTLVDSDIFATFRPVTLAAVRPANMTAPKKLNISSELSNRKSAASYSKENCAKKEKPESGIFMYYSTD